METTTVTSRPTMPLPFERTNLKETIRRKRSCSPVDLSNLPSECDRLLNLPAIEQPDKEKHREEEIDCGDLFGSEKISFLLR